MKKFYTTLLCALVALSAAANGPKLTLKKDFQINKIEQVVTLSNAQEALGLAKKDASTSSPAKAAATYTAENMEGEYNLSLGDYYFQSSVGQFSSTATVSFEEGLAVIDSEDFALPVYALPNSTYTSIQFSSINFGAANLGSQTAPNIKYVQFVPYVYDSETNNIVPTNYSINFYGYVFDFPADYGFGWAVYDDEEYQTLAGWIDILDVISMVKADAWESHATSSFVDGILAPGFGVSLTEPSEVKIYKHNYEDSYYMIEDPWSGLYSALNFNKISPSIYLDASDPTDVIMEMAATNINGGDTDGAYYIMSRSFYEALNGSKTEDDYKITYTEENGMGKFYFPVRSCLTYAATANKFYYAATNPTTISFVLPETNGISDIVDEDSNAPVKYYNLQGVEVNAPQAGQLVIRKQGNKAEKVVIR